MRILVLGGAGMLGHKMVRILQRSFEPVYCTVRSKDDERLLRELNISRSAEILSNIDVTKFDELRTLIERLQPTFIINCVGVIKQRAAAMDPIASIAANALLPHKLCQFAGSYGGRVIHFSTDCVFSGKKGSYRENDASDAEDLYGRTKFLGETQSPIALTLRTSMIGRELHHRQSLLEWFLSQDNGTVRGFQKAIYTGVTTNYLSEVVENIVKTRPELSGLYQIASKPISKYDLLSLLRDAYRVNIEIEPDHTVICDRSMVGTRFEETTGIICPSWPELVRRLVNDPTPYERIVE